MAPRPAVCMPQLHRLAAQAVRERGVPATLAHEAVRVTAGALLDQEGCEISTRRVSAYFWGVIRRRCLLQPGDAGLERLRARYVLESIRRDLMAGGMSARAVEAELLRHHGDLVRTCEQAEQLAIPA